MKYWDVKLNCDNIGLLFYLTGIIFLLVYAYIALSGVGLWADEIYTLSLVQMPFKEFLTNAINDVHPILYYLLFKIFIKVFSFLDIALGGKIFSLIPLLLIGILSITKIRKDFGMLTAGLFFFCICSMPRIIMFAFEVRMYSWALFFVTASVIYAYEALKTLEWKNWIILTVLTIASAYTHYFSAVASFSIYLMMLIHIIKTDKSLLKKYIVSASAAVISYIPWLMILYMQAKNVSANYWIDAITFKTVISYVYYILSPAFDVIRGNELVSPTIAGTLLLIAFIYLLYKNRDKFSLSLLAIFILVPLLGIAFSLVKQPVFHIRYIVPSLGIFWLMFSYLFAKSFKNPKISIPIILLLLFVAISGVFAFIPIHDWDVTATEIEHSYISNIDEGSTVIINQESVYCPLFYYHMPGNHYITVDSSQNINEVINDAHINNNSKIYYVDNNPDIIQNLRQSGLNLKEITTNEPVIGYRIYEIA